MSAIAWERHGSWVKTRWGLTDRDIEKLMDTGILPLPDGSILVTPGAWLELVRRVEQLERALEQALERRKGGRSG